MRSTRFLLLLVAALLLASSALAFFDTIGYGGGGGGGGGCGGGGGAAPEEEETPEAPAQPSNLVFVFTGKAATGKTFMARRFAALLAQQDAWNITAVPLSLGAYVAQRFAAERGLDAARLTSGADADWDYRDEHFAALNRYGRELRAAEPFWQFDALDAAIATVRERASTSPSARVAFVVDDAQFRFQLRALQQLKASGAVPGLDLLTVRVTADDATRAARGWKSGRAAPSSETDLDPLPASYWNRTFANAGAADSVVEVDNFLAATLLRDIAK